jgi:putative membrane protein
VLGHAGGGPAPYLLVTLAAVGAVYVVLVARQDRPGRRWSRWRTAAFLAGLAALGLALQPSWLPYGPGDARRHMLQHLVIGMYAPLGLVLGAPVTLLLRSLPRRRARQLGRLLMSSPARLVANPVTAAVASLGGLGALYLTPLAGWADEHPVAHHAVHLHVLVAGCLFAWVVAGADPVPHRMTVPRRLVVVGVAVAAHAVVAQLLHAGVVGDLGAGEAERRGAATLMYYGGDVAELLLALALVTTWRRAPEARTSRAT